MLSPMWPRQRAQRTDVVDDPHPAAMRRKHQIVFAFLERDVAHGEAVGEVVGLELGPRLAAVQRREQAHLGAEEQDVGVEPVFLDHMGVAANARRAGADDPLPRTARIDRAVEVGLQSP